MSGSRAIPQSPAATAMGGGTYHTAQSGLRDRQQDLGLSLRLMSDDLTCFWTSLVISWFRWNAANGSTTALPGEGNECPGFSEADVPDRANQRLEIAKSGRSADASEHPARLAGCPCRGGFMRNCFAVRRPQIGAGGCLAMLWCLSRSSRSSASRRSGNVPGCLATWNSG